MNGKQFQMCQIEQIKKMTREDSNVNIETERGLMQLQQYGSYLNKMKPMDSTAALLTSSFTSLT